MYVARCYCIYYHLYMALFKVNYFQNIAWNTVACIFCVCVCVCVCVFVEAYSQATVNKRTLTMFVSCVPVKPFRGMYV